MARYTDDSKERVRDAVDMIDLVSARTELRRAGANRFEGLCPFHDERTPSFGIDPVKKVYHCFGCGAGGDVFRFVQETEGVDFAGALELLADRYGVELEREAEDPREAERRRQRERLYALLERTAAYYARYLWEAGEARGAREYLARRGLTRETLERFRVGYAPKPWDHMVKRWRGGGYSEQELLAAGLVKRGRQQPGIYDHFRGRLMFPLCNLRGRVVGFGARALREDQRPKYLNSPEGEIYHKGRQLFGADVARSAAARAGAVVLVEGYTDVLALQQAGIDNAVGLMGTAMTDHQLRALAQLVGVDGSVLMALDADAAGQEAMVRAATLAEKRDVKLRVVSMPAGTDPAELVAAEGPDAVRARLDQAVAFARFRVEQLSAGADTLEQRTRAFESLRPLLSAMKPTPEREELRRFAAGRLQLPPDLAALLTVPVAGERPPPAGDSAAAPVRRALSRREESERAFLALCIAMPSEGREALRNVVDEHFTSPLVRTAAAHLRQHLAKPTEGLDGESSQLSELVAELILRAASEPADADTLKVSALQLEKSRLERRIDSASAAGLAEVSELAAQKQRVQRQIDTVMAER